MAVLGFPDHLPFFDVVLWDDEGRLWVAETLPGGGDPAQLAVYADTGELLGEVELPTVFSARAIAGGVVWGTS